MQLYLFSLVFLRPVASFQSIVSYQSRVVRSSLDSANTKNDATSFQARRSMQPLKADKNVHEGQMLLAAKKPTAGEFLLDTAFTGCIGLLLLRTRNTTEAESVSLPAPVPTPAPKPSPAPAPASVAKAAPAPAPAPKPTPKPTPTPAPATKKTEITPKAKTLTPQPPAKRDAKAVTPTSLLTDIPSTPNLIRSTETVMKEEPKKEPQTQVVESVADDDETKGPLAGKAPKILITVILAAIIGVLTTRPF